MVSSFDFSIYNLCERIVTLWCVWKFICFLHMTSYMTSQYLFFQMLHIKIGWLVKATHSESSQIQNMLIRELKTLSCWELSRRWPSTWMFYWYSLAVPVAGIHCFLLWCPLVSLPIVPAALNVHNISLLCSMDSFGWDLHSWSRRLVLEVLPGAGMWVCCCWAGTQRRITVSGISSPNSPCLQDCYICDSTDHTQAGGVWSLWWVVVHGLVQSLAGTGDHLLPPSFSKVSCARNQTCLFPMLSISLLMRSHLNLSAGTEGKGGGTELKHYMRWGTCRANNLLYILWNILYHLVM